VRTPRALVLGALALLLVGGLAEIEAWPMTAWRLFSESRRAEQAGWSIRAVDADGTTAPVVLADLPLGYRLAAWPLGDAVASASDGGAAVCRALLEEVRADRPATVELRIARTRRRLVEGGGGWWSVEVSTGEPLRCGREGEP
jgi:hypothetical protein